MPRPTKIQYSKDWLEDVQKNLREPEFYNGKEIIVKDKLGAVFDFEWEDGKPKFKELPDNDNFPLRIYVKRVKRTAKPSPLERFEEVFKAINDDDDKAISLDEFKEGMASVGVPADVAENMFNRFDPDRSGQLDRAELFAYAAKGTSDVRQLFKRIEDEEELQSAFENWDEDGDGIITKLELERVLVVLNPSFTKKDLTKLMKAVDKNGDGKIDYEEFTQWVSGRAS